MDAKRIKKIKDELKKAEEYLNAAELLQKHGLYTPSAISSYYSAFHASVAAFQTCGHHPGQKEQYTAFTAVLNKFDKKLDPFIERLMKSREGLSTITSAEYGENEALLRFYHTREFLVEIKDFIRRIVKF